MGVVGCAEASMLLSVYFKRPMEIEISTASGDDNMGLTIYEVAACVRKFDTCQHSRRALG